MGRDTPAPHELSEMESLHAQLERERAIATRLFGLANSCDDLHALLREATALLHEWSGCDAVGIRLREGDDFPYFETRGFPPEFVEAENSLCVPDLKGQVARDFQGNPILECMCGNILCGRFDPALPFFSPGGSFWTNGTTELLASTTEAQRQARTRNRCNGQGYESVALIPLRSEGATLGLLQLNDRQKGRFSARLILALEQFAAAIAGAVEHCLVSRQLTQTRAQLQEQNAELGESYRRLAGLLDAVDQSLLLMSRDGTIIECNQVFASRLGHTREELLGSDVYCHLPPDVARQRRQRVEEAADSRMVVGFVDEQWGRRLAHRIVPIMDEHGNVIQFAAQGTDITQQSQSHERLQRSNELLRAVKDVQALFISETDPKRVFQGLLKILVQFTQSEYGFLDEVLAREDGTTFKRNLAITDISWDDASRRLFDQLASAEYVFPNLDNLAGAPVTLGRVVISNNPACDRRSGGLPSGHPPLGCFLGIPLHSAGKMVGVAGVANRPGGYTEEVAEFIEPLAATCAGMIAALQTRRKAEEAEAKYRVVADNTYDWEFWVSPEGHFRYVSPSCQRITGYEPAEFMADPELFLRIVHPADREDVRRYMQSGSAGHRGLEFRIVRKDGTLRWIGLRCQPVCDAQGRPWGVRGSNRDITQRKQSERLLIIERDLAAALNGAHEMHDILRHSLSAALDATGFDCGGVYLPHGPSGELRLAHHAGLSTAFVEAAATFGPGSQQSLLVSRGEFVQFDGELLADPAFAHLWQEGLRSLVVVPVVHEGRVLACLNLASRNPVTLSAWRRNALEALALQMGTAIDRAAAEAALRRSQAELRATYDSSPIMMCVLDEQRCLLHMNRAMQEFIGKSEDQLRQQRACGIIGCINALDDPRGCGYGPHCESCSLRLAIVDTLQTGQTHRGIERRMRLVIGDAQRDVVLLGATALIHTQATTNLLLCLEDITQRRKAEDDLRLQAMVLDQIADHVTVTDLEGRISYVNDAQCRSFNRSRKELVGRSVEEYGDDPLRGTTQQEIVHATLRDGQWRGEVVNRAADDREMLLDCRTRLVVDDAGRPVAICGIATDISARKQMEEALRESAEVHRALVEGLPDIVMRFDRQGRHLFVSPNVAQIVDIPAAVFLGKTHRELGFPESQCRMWEESIRRVFDTRLPLETEFSIATNRGLTVFNWRLVPQLASNGDAQSVLSIARDITAHRRMEQDYAMLFQQMQGGFALHEIVVDEQGEPVDYRFLAVNPAFEHMTGLRAEVIVGKTVREVMPETEEHWIQRYGRVALTGEPISFEEYAQGLGKWFAVTAFRPGPQQFACSFSDITERKRMETTLRGNTAMLDHAEEIADMGSAVWDVSGNTIAFSRGAHTICGLAAGALATDLQKTIAQVVHPQDRARVIAGLEERGHARRFDLLEFRIVRSDTSVREITCVGEFLLDSARMPLKCVLVFHDVTELRRAEQARLAMEDHYRRIVETANEGIWTMDANYRTTFVNPQMAAMLGYTKEEILDRAVTDFMPPEDVVDHEQRMERRRRGENDRYERRFRRKDGSTCWTLVSSQSIRDEQGAFAGSFGMFTDITRHKEDERRFQELESQLRHAARLTTLGQLTAGIAHEVNQPLCAIVNFAHACKNVAVQDNPDLESLRRWCDAIAGAATRSGDIVRRMTGFARRGQPEWQEIAVQQLIDEAVVLVGFEARQRQVAIRTDLGEEELRLRIPPVQIHQVLVNLLRNAIEAFRDERSANRAVTVRAEATGEEVCISVADNGPGLGELDPKAIFEPFFTTKNDGLGLGLGISRTIVESHGGRIWAAANAEGGLTVSFTLLKRYQERSE